MSSAEFVLFIVNYSGTGGDDALLLAGKKFGECFDENYVDGGSGKTPINNALSSVQK